MPRNDVELFRMIQDAWEDPLVYEETRMRLERILGKLGTEKKNIFGQHDLIGRHNLDFAEQHFRHKLHGAAPHLKEMLEKAMSERAEMVFEVLSPHLGNSPHGTSVLDLGCGSGEISELVHKNSNLFATCADVRDWRTKGKNLQFREVKDNHVSADDHEFDHAMALTVLHHSNNPEKLLRELFRVGQAVTIIESVTNNLHEYKYGTFIDWFYNRIIHFSHEPERKINVPCLFLPATGWEQMIWRITGRTPTVSIDLGVYQILNPEHHWLFHYAAE